MSMRRLGRVFVPIAAIGAFVFAGDAHAVTYGISDQQASTFANPLYKPLKLRTARYITSYDVVKNPAQLAQLLGWVAAAHAAHQKILLSVEHSRLPGRAGHVPSNSEYKKDITAIYKLFGKYVESFSSWNEVNVGQKNGRTEGQPARIASLKRGPKIVAGYFKVARKVFKHKKIVGLDVLDGSNKRVLGATKRYIRAFRKHGGSRNRYWGLHNYSDTNRYSDHLKRTKTLLRLFGRGQVWLTETGGQIKLRDHVFGTAKAAKSLGCMVRIAKRYKKIARVYVYQFNGAGPDAPFDAGLIDEKGAARPGYKVVQKRKASHCHK